MGLGVSAYQKPGESCFNFNCALSCSQLFHETKQLAVDQHKVSQLLAWGIISPTAHNSSRQHLRPRIHLHLRNLTITTHSSLGKCLHCRPTLQGAERHATKGAGTQDVITNPLQLNILTATSRNQGSGDPSLELQTSPFADTACDRKNNCSQSRIDLRVITGTIPPLHPQQVAFHDSTSSCGETPFSFSLPQQTLRQR